MKNQNTMQTENKIDCYIINLDISVKRWETIKQCEEFKNVNTIRVSAVNGAEIRFPHPDFSAWKYFLFYGRKPTIGEIGCYFSHVRAMRIFLESQKTHCIVCEDDFEPVPNFTDVIGQALKYAETWDILRLYNTRHFPLPYADLGGGYKLATPLRPGSATLGYMINRTAAKKFLSRCFPMWKPVDDILFSDVPFLKEAVIYPFIGKINNSSKQSEIEKINTSSTICPSCFEIPEADYASVASRSGCSRAKPTAHTGFGITRKNMKYSLLHPAALRFSTVIPWRLYSCAVRYIYNFTTAILRRILYRNQHRP
ncbi:MAG: glycosyltransferase family 25 protein [Planctomycetaceae bacterium]|jgi:glycosyl transferase family 25|nr:glycosyltransferase family 25 protein [Planctomycetaceae bacterium]